MSSLSEIIVRSSPDDVCNDVVDYLFGEICKPMESYDSYSKRMSTGQRMAILIWCLSAEAANGGIHQFLANSSGDSTDETIEHLKRIGATPQVECFDRIAKEVFNGAIPSDQEKRVDKLMAYDGENEVCEELAEEMQEKAEAFFDEIDKHFGWCKDIKLLAASYIKEHPSEFDA